MSNKRGAIQLDQNNNNNYPSKRIRNTTNRYGTRESGVNYNSFFDQALNDFEINTEQKTESLSTNNVVPILDSNTEKKHDPNFTNQIVITISTITEQIVNISKRLRIFENQMVQRAKESKPESNAEMKCDSNLDTILPIDDVSSLDQLEVKLQNRSFKILLVIEFLLYML